MNLLRLARREITGHKEGYEEQKRESTEGERKEEKSDERRLAESKRDTKNNVENL